jgi:hypothetical protein
MPDRVRVARQEVTMNVNSAGSVREQGDAPHVSIAYNFQDREFARKLATALRRDRVSPWIQETEMTGGDSLAHRLSTTTRPVDAVIAGLSVASVTQNWVERELPAVMTKEINWRRIVVVPARIDGCLTPSFLKGRFIADFHGSGWNQAYANVRLALRRRVGAEQSAQRPATARLATPAQPAAETEEDMSGTKQVYLCYDAANDGYYKDVLVTWSKIPGFAQFMFNDQPYPVVVDSEEAEPLKRAITARIGATSGLLCVVGAKCCSNGWLEWEIRKADELGKRIIAVRINRECAVPELLSDVGATCAMSFTFEGIRRALEEAYGGCALD